MSCRVPLERLPTIVSAMEENLHGHVAFLQHRLSGMTVQDHDDLLLVDSGLSSNTFNKVCRARLSAADVDRRIAEAVEYFRKAGRPFAWWVGPGCRPLDLEARLEEQGLVAFETETGMVMEMHRLAERAAVTSQLEVHRVGAMRQLQDFVEVLDACGHPPDRCVEAFFRVAASELLQPNCPMRLFVGYVDDRPVATSELFIGGEAAGVHMVATHPEFRRRGVGWAVTWAALNEGRRLGLKTATLQASMEGEGLYSELGFRAVCRFTEYQPRR